MTSVMQPWTHELPMMQQSVLMTAVRGPDGVAKYHPSKYLLRWYRRCVLYSAMDHSIVEHPCLTEFGGSFTGPSVRTLDDPRYASGPMYQGIIERPGDTPNLDWHPHWWSALDDVFAEYLKALDEIPHHFQLHFMHAIEIVGYHHPMTGIASWWQRRYVDLAEDMHLHPETKEELNARLGDDIEGWLKRSHKAVTS